MDIVELMQGSSAAAAKPQHSQKSNQHVPSCTSRPAGVLQYSQPGADGSCAAGLCVERAAYSALMMGACSDHDIEASQPAWR